MTIRLGMKHKSSGPSEPYLRAIKLIENSPAAIFCKDYRGGQGVFVEWNLAAEALWGIKKEDVLGKTDFDLFPKEQAEFFRKKDLETLISQKLVVIEREHTDSPKGRLELKTWKVAIQDDDGSPRFLLGMSLDITSQIELEDQLIEAKQQAEKATQTKAAFLANMSHEIRTPMNGIIGMSNLLLSSTTDSIQIERIRIIQNCANSLLDILNDILDFSKLEVNKVELEKRPFALHETVNEVVELLNTRASEKGITLSYKHQSAVPDSVKGDVTRFRQIVTNLVSNALKFTDKGSIQIFSEGNKIDSNTWILQFSVKDSGTGIPEELKSKLFRSFSQVDASTTRKFGGTGLGLAICKGLCEKMGGTIWVDSEVGVGSTFSFTFKAEEVSASSLIKKEQFVTTIDPNMGQKHPLRILIAEDNRTNQLVAIGLLGKLGYQADIASDGKQALDYLEKQAYDLVFMDCHMPELDGFQTSQKIHQKYLNLPRPRIVALTASTMKEDIDHCFKSGMDDFISKPVTIPELTRALKETQTLVPQTNTLTPSPEAFSNRSYPSFDSETFLKNYIGLEEIAKEAISDFVQSLPKLVTPIEKAIQTANAKNLESSAHTLKGVVSNFYAEPSRKLAWELEQMGSRRSLAKATLTFEQLKFELNLLKTALLALLKTKDAA